MALSDEFVRGVLLGVAFGDTYGLLYEYEARSPSSVWLNDPILLRGVEVRGYYAYSDDTETTLILGESLVSSCGFNPSVFADLLARKAEVDNPVRFYGSAVASVVYGLRKGEPWWIVARSLYGGLGSFGNGAAIRVSPIPLFYREKKMIESMAVAQAIVTHTHILGVEGARLHALALHYTLEGIEPSSLLDLLTKETSVAEYRKRLQAIPRLLDSSPIQVARQLGNTAAAHESVAAALYVYIASDGDPVKAVLYAISIGGDVDSIASMAASLVGALKGEKVFPQNLLENMEAYKPITSLAGRLVEATRDCPRRQLLM